MTPEEFRKAGHKLVDWIADYGRRAEHRKITSGNEPFSAGEIRAQLPSDSPQTPEDV